MISIYTPIDGTSGHFIVLNFSVSHRELDSLNGSGYVPVLLRVTLLYVEAKISRVTLVYWEGPQQWDLNS